ncbi:class I SAM-dependent methyltransferase [Rufibacter quisquiliarum]|uniref:Ubiquinone/menaquinone biosynthesis C-methylase UbiE n=1 Tax=Rufibacter quisquiliarum TaxID=1549639 RepID=A0A839GBC1_9BACT|nr:class I SAM-dependent methyltransferase [Rufibacter quisquiliarum]MBA9076844.1 ubiquinone/menaquinone biosynthesis C-methylase UbiE [Rufibacter quisquiliarum]
MPSKPSPDFNLIAPVYDTLAVLVFGQAQKRAQQHFLPQIPAGARVLVLGGGSGFLLTQLFGCCTPGKVLFLEASGTMLQKARQRLLHLPHAAAVEFRCGTEQDLLPHETFHVVLTPFVLDLFTPPEAAAMINRLAAALLPSGLWLHTDFHLSAGGRNRRWQQFLLWAMYRFFRKVSQISASRLPPLDQLLGEAGFAPRQQAFFYRGFIKAQVLQAKSPPKKNLKNWQ